MVELKDKIEKMEKDINSLVADLKALKEKMQNKNTLLKDDRVLLLERRLDEKFDILNEKQNEYHDSKHKQLSMELEHHDAEP